MGCWACCAVAQATRPASAPPTSVTTGAAAPQDFADDQAIRWHCCLPRARGSPWSLDARQSRALRARGRDRWRQRDREEEGAATLPPGLSTHELAAHEVDQALGDAQPQARAPVFARGGRHRAWVKPSKIAPQFLGRDADALYRCTENRSRPA